MKGDTPNRNQQHKSILKSDAISPSSGERKSVHFMVNEEVGAATDNAVNEALAAAGVEQADSEDANMEQLMAAADGASATPDKDSSTITIFNENGDVLTIVI